MNNQAIIVHGGCGTIDQGSIPDRIAGVREAAEAGWKILQSGGLSVDAVEAAVVVMENNPLFNAGTGSTLNRDGRVEMDAAIMNGADLAAGAVAAVQGILNPIKVARRILEVGPHVLLVAKGAEDFANSQGMETGYDPARLITARRRRQWEDAHGTVGACACARDGRLAAATSTGGSFNKLPGRVGDSPLLGCGTYANQEVAISCTGDGEQIMRMTLARLAAFLYPGSSSQAACNFALEQFESVLDGEVGIILVDHRGQPAYAQNTRNMPVCAITEAGVQTTC